MKKHVWKFCALASVGFALVLGSCHHGKDPIDSSSSGGIPDSSLPDYPDSSSHTPTGDTWDVTFDFNYETKFKTYLVEEVKDGNPVKKPSDPLRQGYDFVDWFRDPYCRLDRKWDFSQMITKPITLYACWERNQDPIDTTDYQITYQACLGASFVTLSGNELQYIAEYGDVVQFKVEVDRDHYEGTPIVQANGVTLEEQNDIYSYTVTSAVQFTISGLTKISAASYFLYYENVAGWSEVYAYMWDSSSVNNEDDTLTVRNAPWPGEIMTLDSKTGLMMYEIENPDECVYDSIIFNGGTSGGQTSDLPIVTSYATNATLYYGEITNVQETSFDPKSTNTVITWKESADYRFVPLTGSVMPTQINRGESVSFRVEVLKTNFTGEITVYANQEVIRAQDGVYTIEAKTARLYVKVTGFIQTGTIDLYYTLPTWDPAATSPKLYYWGTDANGTSMHNTIAWDDANDPQGAMEHVSGNDYKLSIDIEEGMKITGIIVVMYQGGVKKQSQDMTTSIVEAGSYQITFVGDWVQNSMGEWVFTATIAEK